MSNLIVFSHEYPPCLGGAGTIARSIFDNFKNKYKTSVITSKRSREFSDDNIFCSKFSDKLWPLSYYLEFKSKFHKADVIICNDPAAIYIAGRYFSDKFLAKTICIVHGAEKHLDGNKKSRLINFEDAFRRAISFSFSVVYVSNYIADFYQENYNILIDKGRCKVINPGVIEYQYDKVRPYNKERIQFITVSRITEKKGLKHLLNIFIELSRRNIDFEWTVVGDGDYLIDFKKLIASLPIYGSVNIIGAVARENLYKYYTNSDFYILLSELNESFGLGYLEAAQFGCRPIGYKKDGVIEAFNHLSSGLLLEDYRNLKLNVNQIVDFIQTNNTIDSTCKRFDVDFCRELDLMVNSIE